MSDRCSLCGLEEEPHAQAEADRRVNHRWSPNGDLIPLPPAGNSAPRQPQQPIMVVGAIDTTLRKILLRKGIITDEDFTAILDPGSSAEGNRGDRETPSPS
jgi:hypothetical protein